MADGDTTAKYGERPWRTIFFHAFLAASVAGFFLYLLLRILLLTPLGADVIERFLCRYTGRAVTVGGFFIAGGTVYVDRVAIESPAGFQERAFLSARSISITPDPAALLTGRASFSSIMIDGLRVNLARNTAGTWNYAGFLDRLATKKRAKGGETRIRRLLIRNAGLRVNGYGWDGVGLDVENVSTQGTADAKIAISGKDSAGTPVRVTAEGRMGPDPSFRAWVSVPSISVTPLGMQAGGGLFIPAAARARVILTADFRHGVFDVRGDCGLDGLQLKIGSDTIPLRTALDFAARWDTRRDEASLLQATLSANDSAKIRVSGSMRRIRSDGAFSLKIVPDPVRLGKLSRSIPENLRRGYLVDGILSSPGCYLEGSLREGVRAGKGEFSIRSASLAGGGRALIAGGGGDLSLVKTGEGWMLNGRLFSGGGDGGMLLDSFDVPFRARFSPRFRPIRVESSAVRAVAAGISVTGRFQYAPALSRPFSITCSADDVSLKSLSSRLPLTAVLFSSGAGKVTARLSGSSVRDFTGSVTATVSSAAGSLAGERFTLGTGRVTSDIGRYGGRSAAEGALVLAKGTVRGKTFGVSLGYSLADDVLTVRNTDVLFGETRVAVPSATVRLPLHGVQGGGNGLPVDGAVAGVGIRSGNVSVSGTGWRVRGSLYPGVPKLRMEGEAVFSLTKLSFRGKEAATLSGRVIFTGSGATATLTGDSLGGKLDATIRGDFLSPEGGISFSLRLSDQQLDRVEGLFPAGTRPRVAGGTASLLLSGTFARRDGLHATLSGTGSGISLLGEGNRTLVSDLGLTIHSRISGENLSIREATVTVGRGVTARVSGEVERFASSERRGNVSFSLPATPVNSLLDAGAAMLPRTLQEAVCDGTCSLDGAADIRGREVRLRGGLALEGASLEISSQKVSVTGVNGTVPLSLHIPGAGVVGKSSSSSFTRENFPKLLQALGAPAAGSGLTIGALRFGALEAGPVSLFMTADRGVLTIGSVHGSLYGGRMMGSGFLLYGNGFQYGADLVVHDVSLRQFCESFPAIKGYITGRVDGVISVLNVEGGIGGLAGYADLWTRSVQGEKRAVSKEFLQKLAGKKLRGFLFTNDRAYDTGEVIAFLRGGFLTFERLDISHTNFLGMKDLNVTVVPVQNRISLEHLLDSIRQAAARGKVGSAGEAPVQTDLKWLE